MSSVLEVTILTVEVVKNYINGKWVESKAKETRDVFNPATGELIAKTPMSTAEEALEAVAAAKTAFERWRKTPVFTRVRHLNRIRDAFEENFEELSELIAEIARISKRIERTQNKYRNSTPRQKNIVRNVLNTLWNELDNRVCELYELSVEETEFFMQRGRNVNRIQILD